MDIDNYKLNLRLFIVEKVLSKLAFYTISKAHLVIISYNDIQRKKIIDTIYSIKGETEMALGINEAYSIYAAVKQTEKIEGDIAEVGVYKGGSSEVICKAKGDRTLHLFDTFEGIPDIDRIDSKDFFKGQYATDIEEVKQYLKQYKNVQFYKGIFPDTSEPVKDKHFSFVHLDVDIYKSTRDCLEFFYPRMNPGGIIISHDYINSEGVKNAFNEFFSGKLDPIIELSGSQCLIVKIGKE
jgi:O-methyltransferase